jgi:mycothiol synthase
MEELELRPATNDDVPAIVELIRGAEAFDGVPRVLAGDELAQDLDAAHLDLDHDTRVVVRGGELAGWAYVWHPPAIERLDRAELYGEVAPAHRRVGVGHALLGWSLARARERQSARTHDLPRFIRVGAYDWLEDRHRLYRRAGFEAVRWNDELIRALDDLPVVPVPNGVALLPWPEDRDEDLRQVRNAAFADHWNASVVQPELWQDFVRGHGSRADLSVLAVDDTTGEIIGLSVNQAYPEDEAVTGRRDAWIANIGTLRAARGRGVASAMIAWSLAAFAAAGFTHALLDVDADNPTGAARLYRNLGFEPHHCSITYEIRLDR